LNHRYLAVVFLLKQIMNKKALLAISLAVLIPLLGYMLVKTASDKAITMPNHYLPDSIISTVKDGKMTTDTSWHKVANIKLVNQLGDTVSLYDIKGKAIVADFFFTSCAYICPTLTQNMAKLQRSFLKGGDPMNPLDSSIVQFVSFTIDPERDSAKKLKQYADKFGVNHDNWWFLTGSKDSIYNFIFQELKVDKYDAEGPIDPNFAHTQRFVLIDKDFHVRGFYNGLDSVAIGSLAKDIGLLTLERSTNPEPLPFDPKQMAIFFAITLIAVVVIIFLMFPKKSKDQNI
jgi:protein SCO1/2